MRAGILRQILICFVFFASVAKADTLLLKDGRKLEWSSMTDHGDSLEVQLVSGAKVNIKKDDVDRVSFVSKVPSLLTGASITFDKKRKLEVFDALAKTDVTKVSGGGASLRRGVLTVNPTPMAQTKIPLNFTPPAEYDLSMVVERVSPSGEFSIGVVAGGKQVAISFDAYRGTVSGVMWYDQKGLIDNPDAYKRPIFGKQPRAITVMVRNEGFVARVDNQDIVAIPVQNFSRLTEHPNMGILDKSTLFVSCMDGTFNVSQVTVSTPK